MAGLSSFRFALLQLVRPFLPLVTLPWGVMMWVLWLGVRRIICPSLPGIACNMVWRGFMVVLVVPFMTATSSLPAK
jgi:hypothetical protein